MLGEMRKILLLLVIPSLLLVGCEDSPFEKYRVGEKCDLNEMKSLYGEDCIATVIFHQNTYTYSEVEFEKDGVKTIISVSPEGKIVEVFSIIPCESYEEEKRVVEGLARKLKELYKDKLADCGAKESQLLIKIDGYENPRHVLVSCRDSKFDKFVKENFEKAKGKK